MLQIFIDEVALNGSSELSKCVVLFSYIFSFILLFFFEFSRNQSPITTLKFKLLRVDREEAEMDDADLEEGEIASDDDEETQTQQEDKVEVKPTAVKVEVKKEDFKTGSQSERSDCLGFKSSGTTTEKRRDKRVPSNSNNSRVRKRTGEDDVPSHRDSHVQWTFFYSSTCH